MWIIALSLLSVVSSANAFGEDFPKLEAPSIVGVGNESDTEVVITWHWTKPSNLSLQRVEFVLVIESAKLPTRIFYPRFGSAPFTYRVSHLMPNTKYTLTIMATAPSWGSSPFAELSFTTMATDWRAPVIREVRAEPLHDVMEYYVRWLLYVALELSHLEVEICQKSCSHLKLHRTDLNTRVRIPYDSKFTLRVAACYHDPIIGHIKRYSIRRSNFTGKSPPTTIFKMVNARMVGNRIKLDWHPSLGPKAPNSYYEVFVCDPSSRPQLFGSSLMLDESGPGLRYSRLEGDAFELSIAPRVIIRRDSTVASRPVVNDEPDSCEIPQPLLFVVVRRTQSAVRFRIVFRNFQRGGLSESQASERDLLLGPEVAEAFGFNADAKLYVKIRTCLNYPGRSVDMCGNFTDFEMHSNVAEPSAVQNLGWSFPAHEKLEISWDRPAMPRGPIDGYEVVIRVNYGNWATSDEELLEANVTSFVIENYNPRMSYEISVAGFNVDREDETIKLTGSRTSIYPSSSWLAHFSWSTSMTSITLILLLILLGCMAANRHN